MSKQKRMFVIGLESCIDVSPIRIIHAICAAYRNVNFIKICCERPTSFNHADVESRKFIFVQQSTNGIRYEAFGKRLKKNFPGTHITSWELSDPEVKDHRVKVLDSWGTYRPVGVHRARVVAEQPDPPSTAAKEIYELTAAEKDIEIKRLREEEVEKNVEIKRLRGEATRNGANGPVTIGSNNVVNSNNNSNVTIQVVFGREGLEHVSPDQWSQLIRDGVVEGLAQFTCDAIDIVHKRDENKTFYMEQADSKDIHVRREGGVYETVTLAKFSRDAPLHYAGVVHSAVSSKDERAMIRELKKQWPCTLFDDDSVRREICKNAHAG